MLHLTISAEEQRRHLHRFWALGSGFWSGRQGRAAWIMTLTLIAVVLIQLGLQYRVNVWNRDFFDALERGERGEVWLQALIFLPLAGISTGFMMLMIWGRMTMQRLWRGWLTSALIDRWSASPDYRQLTVVTGEHRNPEYRIAEDARVATELPVDFGIALFSSLLSALTFIGVLWSIGGDIVLPIFGQYITFKGYLVIAVILYSGLTTFLMLLAGDRLVPVVEEKNQAESELRFAATRLREASETDGFGFERASELPALRTAVARVLAGWRKMCEQLMGTVLVSQGNTLLAPVIGLLLCVPKYLVDAMTLGEVIQASAAFVIVQGAFNWVVDNYPRVADWLSSVNRVALLLDWLDGATASVARPEPVAESSLLPRLAGPPALAPVFSAVPVLAESEQEENGNRDTGSSLRL